MDIRQRNTLIMVIFTSVLGQIATDIYLPSLPNLEQVFGVGSYLLQISISIFFSGYAISQIICGPLSDQYGRKIFMIAGVLIFAIGCYFAKNSQIIQSLILSRFIQGLGTGCFGVANRAILYDTFQGKDYSKSISIVSIVMAISPLLAPGFGATLHNYYGWQSTFYFMQGYALILLALLIKLLPETLAKKAPIAIKRKKTIMSFLVLSYNNIIKSQDFWIYGLINMLGFAAFIVFLGNSSFIIQHDLGFSPLDYGKFISLLSFGYISGGLISNRLIDSKSRYDIINIGNHVQQFSLILYLILSLTSLHLIFVMLLPMVFFVLGTGMINPNSTAELVTSFPSCAATAAAAMGTLMTLGTSILTSVIFLFSNNTILELEVSLVFMTIGIRVLINYSKKTILQPS